MTQVEVTNEELNFSVALVTAWTMQLDFCVPQASFPVEKRHVMAALAMMAANALNNDRDPASANAFDADIEAFTEMLKVSLNNIYMMRSGLPGLKQ